MADIGNNEEKKRRARSRIKVVKARYPLSYNTILNHKKTQSQTRYIRTIKIEENIHFSFFFIAPSFTAIRGSAADKSIQDKTNEQGNFVVITFFDE